MPDIFDRIKPDLFDTLEMPTEDKVIQSEDMANLIREEIYKEISKIPVGKIVARIMEREAKKQNESVNSLKTEISDEVNKAKSTVDKKISAMRSEIEEFMEKMRKKFDTFRNEPQYQFGGFPLSGGGLPFANWRFREDGTELVVETLVNGAWVESSAFLQPE